MCLDELDSGSLLLLCKNAYYFSWVLQQFLASLPTNILLQGQTIADLTLYFAIASSAFNKTKSIFTAVLYSSTKGFTLSNKRKVGLDGIRSASTPFVIVTLVSENRRAISDLKASRSGKNMLIRKSSYRSRSMAGVESCPVELKTKLSSKVHCFLLHFGDSSRLMSFSEHICLMFFHKSGQPDSRFSSTMEMTDWIIPTQFARLALLAC